MAKNTSKWLRRSKKKFSTSHDAWVDIEATTNYTKQGVKAIHRLSYVIRRLILE